MTISNYMKFKVTTVIDITETNVRRGEDKKKEKQQANFNAMFQTIGLRVNVDPISLTESVVDVKGLGFGDAIKGKQRVWVFEFENPYEGALSYDMLVNDFDLVPIITDLDETANINNSIFCTNHPNDTNIIFSIIDK